MDSQKSVNSFEIKVGYYYAKCVFDLRGLVQLEISKKRFLYCIFGKYEIWKIFGENFIKIRVLFTVIYDFKRSSFKRT